MHFSHPVHFFVDGHQTLHILRGIQRYVIQSTLSYTNLAVQRRLYEYASVGCPGFGFPAHQPFDVRLTNYKWARRVWNYMATLLTPSSVRNPYQILKNSSFLFHKKFCVSVSLQGVLRCQNPGHPTLCNTMAWVCLIFCDINLILSFKRGKRLL